MSKPTQGSESQSYPHLLGLIRGYFHQDYDIVSEDPDEVIREFRALASDEQVEAVILDIDEFILKHGSDELIAGRLFREIFKPEAPLFIFHCRSTIEGLHKMKEILQERS